MFSVDTRILVVDDAASQRNFVRHMLKELGFKDCIEASGVDEAYATLKNELSAGRPIGLTLIDWMMPGKTGLDLLVLIRKDESFKNLPAIIVTSSSEVESVIEAVKHGADSYLVKPIQVHQVQEKLAQVYKKRAKPA